MKYLRHKIETLNENSVCFRFFEFVSNTLEQNIYWKIPENILLNYISSNELKFSLLLQVASSKITHL